MQTLTLKARLYLTCVLLCGALSLVYSAWNWHISSPLRLALMATLGIVASQWKVRLPGVNGTMSVLCVVVLISVAELNASETMFVVSAATFCQSIFFVRRRTKLIQIFFNIALMASSTLVTIAVFHFPFFARIHLIPAVALMLGAAVNFFTNTVPIAGIIALTEGGSLKKTWTTCYLWSLPFYLVAAVIAASASAASRIMGWQASLVVVPVVYVIYRSFNLYTGRIEEDRRHAAEISDLHLRTISALALAIEAKDQTTATHLARVQVYAVEIGKELKMSEPELQALRAASLLHDIGKLAVPEHIISKPGKLTREEFEKMKIHPIVGAEILERVNFPYPVTPIVRSHHEKWNGEGYPDGLKAEEIPLGARILAAVDCLDALASDRQYRKALPLNEAMAKVSAESGTSFDPRVVAVLEQRYEQLEQLAREAADSECASALSLDIKVGRGAAPANGFETTVGTPVCAPEIRPKNFVDAISAARQEVLNLLELTQDLGSDLSLQDALSVFAARLKPLVAHDCVAIYLNNSGRLKPVYVMGENFRYFSSLTIPFGMGLSGWVAENRKPIVNGNPAVEGGGQTHGVTTLRSALSVPLEAEDRVIGVLSLYLGGRDAFSNDHLRILLSIAPKLARTIENTIRYESAESCAGTDYLTGMPNTRSLFAHLDGEISRCRRLDASLAVLVGDLDNFRAINESIGQEAASALLRDVAAALQNACRPYDYVARMGGDEFVIVMPEISQTTLAVRVRELSEAVEALAPDRGRTVPLTITFGTAGFSEDGSDADRLLAIADQRMYAAKRRKRAALAEVRLLKVPA